MSRKDYIVVGAGPAGLTSAWLLAKCGKSVTVIESAQEIGGCHRVIRHDGKFSEHGPRVYSSAYKTLARLLNDMGVQFNDIFTPYKFKMSSIGGRTVSNMHFSEIFQLTSAYIQHMLGRDYTKISMREFTKNFTPNTIDYIDRLCILTDGSKIDDYSVDKFLNLMNQQVALYDLYQPRTPNDLGLFKIWRKSLEDLGVEILTNTKVNSLIIENNTVYGAKTDVGDFYGNNVILAIPPKPLYELLKEHNVISKSWVDNNSYIDYITINYEWNKKISSVWGFPATKWGVAHIVLSDYFGGDRTLISAGITKVDVPNDEGITARNATPEQLIKEVLKQLRESYDLPEPDSAIIGSRIGQENAYVRNTKDPSFLPFQLGVKNLYNVGTQNGKSQYVYTSMESAVVNAHALVHELEPFSKKYPIIDAWTLNWVLVVVLLVVLLVSSVYFYKKKITLQILTV